MVKKRIPIPFEALSLRVYDLWENQWLLLTAGDFSSGHYNAMTVGWGSIGRMWDKPFVQVVVRPTRYTYQFMERYDTFTLCAFSEPFRFALTLLGTKSGRNCNKIQESGLHPISAQYVKAPCFEEAELVFECQKIYWDDFEPGHFLDPAIYSVYPQKDYHRVYFGEILGIWGTEKYKILS